MSHEVTSHPLAGIEARPTPGHYGVYDHGAHAWAWQPPGHQPVLWVSGRSLYQEGSPIRGGVPIIFPWFGTGASGDLQPAHGFARLHTWERRAVLDTIDTDGTLVVEYRSDATRTGPQPHFPHDFVANLTTVFTKEYLEIGLEVVNVGEAPFTFEEALHTYLAVGDISDVSIAGLDGAGYRDRAAGAPQQHCVQRGPVTFEAETDRLYTHAGTVVLDDVAWGRQLSITKEGSANTVVWNPWIAKSASMPDFGDEEWRSMVCVEAANALEDAVTLAPGQTHLLRQRITVADRAPTP